MRTTARALWPRNPYPIHPRPLSRAVYGPAALPGNAGNAPTEWDEHKGVVQSRPYFYGHDELHGRLMAVSQADLYNSDPNPWPANGVNDQPNAAFHLIRLTPHTSAHPGASLAGVAGSGPTMVFHTPPVFGLQTTPIWAVGV